MLRSYLLHNSLPELARAQRMLMAATLGGWAVNPNQQFEQALFPAPHPAPTFSTTVLVSFSLIQGFSSAHPAMVLSAAARSSFTPARI